MVLGFFISLKKEIECYKKWRPQFVNEIQLVEQIFLLLRSCLISTDQVVKCLALCYGKGEKWQMHFVYRHIGHSHCKDRQKFLRQGGSSAPAMYNMPEHLCSVQKQKKI